MSWIVLPVVGALIGWVTNFLAIRLLFRPRRPLRLAGLTIQGLLPRRQADLAAVIGEIVARELLPPDKLVNSLLQPDLRQDIVATASQQAARTVRERLPGFVPQGLRQWLADLVRDASAVEVQRFLAEQLPRLLDGMAQRLKLEEQVRDRLLALDLDELERLVQRLARRELRHIEWMGAVLGFVIGLLQALFLSLAP
ncbi:MAG TPA: DUF445 family protein [Bacillota bacterium]